MFFPIDEDLEELVIGRQYDQVDTSGKHFLAGKGEGSFAVDLCRIEDILFVQQIVGQVQLLFLKTVEFCGDVITFFGQGPVVQAQRQEEQE